MSISGTNVKLASVMMEYNASWFETVTVNGNDNINHLMVLEKVVETKRFNCAKIRLKGWDEIL